MFIIGEILKMYIVMSITTHTIKKGYRKILCRISARVGAEPVYYYTMINFDKFSNPLTTS